MCSTGLIIFKDIDTPAIVIRRPESGSIMAFSKRTGGCSPEPFNELNFSVSVGDTPENVAKNFRILADFLQISPNRIITCNQVHGDNVIVVDRALDVRRDADAIVSVDPKLFPAIKVADCVPVVILDLKKGFSAAVHAGRLGTAKKIAKKTAHLLTNRLGSNPEDLFAAIGPAIGPCCYEIRYDAAHAFLDDPDMTEFVKAENGAYKLDLPAANIRQLLSEGIPAKNITHLDACTACNPGDYYSYRGSGGRTGRHIALAGFPG
jgi:polyphenol oxidase